MKVRNQISQVKIVSWNTRCKSFKRVKPIVNRVTTLSQRSIILFQEVPKWTSAVLRKGELFANEESTTAIYIPKSICASIKDQSSGKHWCAILVDAVLLISLHVVDHVIDGRGGDALKTLDNFIAKCRHLVHRGGAKLCVIVGG